MKIVRPNQKELTRNLFQLLSYPAVKLNKTLCKTFIISEINMI